MPYRLGVFLSHPIQYYAPWFRYLAQRMDIEVFYAHRQDAVGQSAAGFGVEFEWDTPLLEGYPYRWLMNVARHPGLNTFGGCDTPEVYDVIRTGGFDAFLVSGWNRKSALQAISACWRNGVPVLMRGDSQLATKRSVARSAAKYLPYRLLLPRLAAHLYVGERNKAYLRHYGVAEEQLFFVPHCVDNAFFAEHAKMAVDSKQNLKIRDELGISHNAFVVLFVGKFLPIKCPEDVIRACLQVFQLLAGTEVHLLLVGDGPLRSELESLAYSQRDRVHFAGFRNQKELPAFYTTANVLIVPGEETWGLVVNEAMACGLPAIVAESVGCAPDLIAAGRTGYIYQHGNTDMLAQRILTMRALYIEDRQAVHQSVSIKIDRYSIERATEGLEDALSAVSKCKK